VCEEPKQPILLADDDAIAIRHTRCGKEMGLVLMGLDVHTGEQAAGPGVHDADDGASPPSIGEERGDLRYPLEDGLFQGLVPLAVVNEMHMEPFMCSRKHGDETCKAVGRDPDVGDQIIEFHGGDKGRKGIMDRS